MYARFREQRKGGEQSCNGSIINGSPSTPEELRNTLKELKKNGAEKASLMAQFLFENEDKLEELMQRKTKLGGTLMDCIKSGIAVPASSVGVYACDPEAYTVFGDMMEYILRRRCKIPDGMKTPSSLCQWEITHPAAKLADVAKEFVVSTRIRVARNIDGFPFPAMISKETRLELEKKISDRLCSLTGEWAGKYYPLDKLSDQEQKDLVANHVLYKDDDSCLETCGAYRDWPSGRGIFFNEDKTFIVWVNEEDHLRIICLKNGALLENCFEFLSKAQAEIESAMEFAKSDKFGHLAFCPSNLGTGMRLSVHMKLPNVSKLSMFKDMCANMNLDIRGTDGEHTESKGGVYDISNKIRFGMSERAILNQVITGVNILALIEKELNEKK